MKAGPPVARDGQVTMEVTAAAGPSPVTFRLPPGVEGARSADAVLAATLLPAMRQGEDLEITAPVSGRLLDGAAQIQDVLWTWDRTLRPRNPWYRRIAVTGERAEDAAPGPGRGTAAFFTGGVDSFHTAVTHGQDLDALIYVNGFDLPLARDAALRAEVTGRLAEAAGQLGLPLIEVETDLRRLGQEAGVPWDDYHGAALATVALLLAPQFSRVLIPATHTYAHLEGLGSHPLLDPLWSTGQVAIVHDGADATRVDKVRGIAEHEAARQHLRVCWENRGGTYNCGRCEKCVRTGAAIRIAGVEGRFPTVPSPSLAQVARVRATGRGSAWHELRGDLVRQDANPRLQRAIDVVLARHQLARWRWTLPWFR